MDTGGRTLRYVFLILLVLILVAYYTGANQLFQTGIAGANQIGLTFTGRTGSGQFAGYAR